MSLLRECRRCPLKSWGPFGGNDFWGNPQEGGSCVSGCRNAPNNFRANSNTLDRAKCPERGNTVPLLPVGVPREVPEGSASELRTLRGALTPGFPPPTRNRGQSSYHALQTRDAILTLIVAHLLISSGGHYRLRSPRGARNSALAHYVRVYLVFRRRSALKERAATFKRRLRRL